MFVLDGPLAWASEDLMLEVLVMQVYQQIRLLISWSFPNSASCKSVATADFDLQETHISHFQNKVALDHCVRAVESTGKRSSAHSTAF